MDEHREEREELAALERDVDDLRREQEAEERRYWIDSDGSDWLRRVAAEMDQWAQS